MLDLPEPFGPTTTATPGSSRSSVGSTNDLKPRSLIDLRCTRPQSLPDGADSGRDAPTRPSGAAVPLRGPRGTQPGSCGGSTSRRSSASRAASCSALFFEGPRPTPTWTPSIDAAAVKVRSCGGALGGEQLVDDALPPPRELLLELGLVVDPVGEREVDLTREGLDDRTLDRLEAVLQVDGGERGLEQRREHVAIALEPRLPPRGRATDAGRSTARRAAAGRRRRRSSRARRPASGASRAPPRRTRGSGRRASARSRARARSRRGTPGARRTPGAPAPSSGA